eukprot:gene663-718_t
MSQIVTVQVGRCGNQVGYEFWKTIAPEQGITNLGRSVAEAKYASDFGQTDVCFSENQDANRFIPRSVLVDSTSTNLNAIRQAAYGEIFSPDNFIAGASSTGNNWAKGHIALGSEMIDSIMEVIRREVEKCDTLQGFQLIHSLGGGTGSGLGTLILSKLRDEYPGVVLASHVVFPSMRDADMVIEPYNSILGLNELIEYCDQCFLYSNSALEDVCTDILHRSYTGYGDINHLIARCMSIVTSGSRFPGSDAFGMRKLAVSTVPYPRMHFLTPSLAPLTSSTMARYESLSVHRILMKLFDHRCNLAHPYVHSTPRETYITAACLFRGRATVTEIEMEVAQLIQHSHDEFVTYIPNNIAVSLCHKAELNGALSAVLLANSSGVNDLFQAAVDHFSRLLSRKAFLHAYMIEGMEELDFQSARENVQDLIAEYYSYSRPTGEEFSDEGDAIVPPPPRPKKAKNYELEPFQTHKAYKDRTVERAAIERKINRNEQSQSSPRNRTSSGDYDFGLESGSRQHPNKYNDFDSLGNTTEESLDSHLFRHGKHYLIPEVRSKDQVKGNATSPVSTHRANRADIKEEDSETTHEEGNSSIDSISLDLSKYSQRRHYPETDHTKGLLP